MADRVVSAKQIHAIHFVPPALRYQSPHAISPLEQPEHPDFIAGIGLDNPSASLKDTFIADWKAKFPALDVHSDPEPLAYHLRAKYAPDLVLEFDTERWLFGTSSLTDDSLHIQLEVHTFLTEPQSGEILWRGRCSFTGNLRDPRSGRKLALEDAIRMSWQPLHQAWLEAAKTCAKEMLRQFDT